MNARHAGTWRIARTIRDDDVDTTTVCAGEATVHLDGNCWRYDETVTLPVGDKSVRATRTYFYRSTPGTLSAAFADGTPFFATAMSSDGVADALHRCGADVYTGTLTFRADDWETHWDVSGTKALRIVTRYTRIPVTDDRVVPKG